MSDSTFPIGEKPRPGGTAILAGHTVSRVGYGAMQLERLHDDRDAAVQVLRRGIELGIDHIDTAQFYGDGFVNSIIHDAVSPEEDDVTVVSKVGAVPDPDPGSPVPMRPAQRLEELRASVHDNLRTLGLEQIPVVNLRRMDTAHRVPVPPEQEVDLDDQLAEMVAMKDEGLIGGIGLSGITLDILRRALPTGIVCVQNAYSLVDRSDEPLLQLCIENGIAWVPYFPLGSAFPGFPKVTDEPDVQHVAEALGVTTSQVGLAWLLHHAPNTLLIPGTSSLEHLEANIAAGNLKLDTTAMHRLDQIPSRGLGEHS